MAQNVTSTQDTADNDKLSNSRYSDMLTDTLKADDSSHKSESPIKDPISPSDVDMDEVLKYVGDFHGFQYLLIALFSVINTLSAFHYFGQTFVSLPQPFTCIHWVPQQQSHYQNRPECLRVTTNGSELCAAWSHSVNFGYTSIVQELNWVCDEDWKPALGQSVFFAGSVVASIVFGVLADRIGRLHTLVMANIFALIGNILTATASDVVQYAAYRFLAGCATDTNFIMMYIIVMEYVRPNMRTVGLNLTIGVFYCVASMAVPWVAVGTQQWTYFLLAIGIPHIIVLGFYLCIPESAQWLLSIGRIEPAIQCYQHIAKFNGRSLEQKTLDSLREYAQQNITKRTMENDDKSRKHQHESFLGLLRTPHLRRKTLILIFKSMVMTLCYDAIARNVTELEYSPFVVFTITSATILPACLLIVAVQDRIGRKALASGSLFLSGIFIGTSGIVLATFNSTPVALTTTILARLAVVVAYNSGHQYAVELIPTQVRGQGVSVIHVAGFVASFFSPQILYLASYWRSAPDLVLGSLLILGAIACLFLPETLNRQLPITLADGEQFGRGEGVFEHILYRSKELTESTYILTIPSVTNLSNITIPTSSTAKY